MGHDVTDFDRDVLQRSHSVPVLADFWAPWCGPCRMLAPVLERLVAEAGNRWVLAKVNVDDHPMVAEEQRIGGIPAIRLFVNGQVVAQFEGSIPERDIRRFLDEHVPGADSNPLRQALELLARRQFVAAAALLEPLASGEPRDDAARIALAECRLSLAPDQVAPLLEGIGAESPLAEKAGALRSLARIAALTDNAGPLPEGPVKARYLAAAAAVRAGDFDAALEGFIDVLGRKRDYDQGGAKKACQAIFLLLGIRHPTVERLHRAFSSALHA